MQMVDGFNKSARTGITLALSFATVVLFIFTGNVIVTAMSVVTIMAVVVSVVGMMVLYGWTLGVIEAVCLTLVSGFAVDYIVHFALSYIACKEDGTFGLGVGRANRVTFAFFEMGISVFSGSITTIGASCFLMLAQLVMFAQFGKFMCTTIVLALLYSNTLFMAMLSMCGPSGTAGSIYAVKCLQKPSLVSDESQ